MTETIQLPKITAENSKTRLDKFLDVRIADLSRERLKKLIKDGHVLVNNQTSQPAYKIKIDDSIVVTIPPVATLDVIAQDIPLDVLYEDEHLIVINKSSDMAVHPASGTPDGTLVNALLHHCKGQLSGIGGVERPGIVHRLDKGTSGVMVVAKDDKAHQGLAKQFHDRTMERFYWALCYGIPNPRIGEIEGNIGRHPKDRKKMAVLEYGGKEARTSYKTLRSFQTDVALIQCKLYTGRTHQIRVHMQKIGHTLLGDPVYGRHKKLTNQVEEVNNIVRNIPHQLLHAKVLGFTHPITNEVLHFESDLPSDMAEILEKLS